MNRFFYFRAHIQLDYALLNMIVVFPDQTLEHISAERIAVNLAKAVVINSKDGLYDMEKDRNFMLLYSSSSIYIIICRKTIRRPLQIMVQCNSL